MKIALTRRRRIILGVLFLFVVLQLSLNAVLGYALRRTFQEGTQCDVALHSPWISFFPLRGSIRDVAIRCEGESPEEGFFSERITVRLALTELLRKKVVLQNLFLHGAHAVSRDGGGGFFRTLEFLFDDTKRVVNTDPDRWRLFVHDVRITPRSEGKTLELIFDQTKLAWTGFTLDSEIPEPDEDPARLVISAPDFQITSSDDSSFLLGQMTAKGTIGQAHLVLTDFESKNSESNATVRASGTALLRTGGNFAINFEGTLPDIFLRDSLSRRLPWLESLRPSAHATGTLEGSLRAPVLESDVELAFAGQPSFIRHQGCFVTDVSAHVRMDTEQIQIRNLIADDILTSELLKIGFHEGQPIEGRAELFVNPEKRIFERCFDRAVPAEETIRRIVSDSRSVVELSGNLNPPALQLKLIADTSRNDQLGQTRLIGRASYTDTHLRADLSEEGVFGSIDRELPTEAATIASEPAQTPFRRKQDSYLAANLELDLAKNPVGDLKVQIEKYPAQRLLARSAPFLEDQLFHALGSITDADSLISGSAQLHIDSSQLRPSGRVVLSSLDLVLGDDRIPVSFSLNIAERGLDLQEVRLNTDAGVISGNLRLTESGNLEGGIKGLSLNLSQLKLFQTRLPFFQGAGDFRLDLAGTSQAPRYNGTLSIVHPAIVPEERQQTEVTLNGDREKIELVGAILGSRGKFTISYPLAATSSMPLRLKANAENFPLQLTPASEERSQDELVGEITGVLDYTGPRTNLLAGTGSLVVNQLRILGQNHEISNPSPLQLEIAGGKLIFTDVRLASGGKEVRVLGGVDSQSGWDARLAGEWEMGTALSAMRGIEQASGLVSADVRITGEPLSPSLSGSIQLTHGAISFPLGSSIIGATDVSAKGTLDNDILVIDEIDASLGDGRVTGTGAIEHLFDSTLRSTRIALEADKVSLEPVDRLALTVDGQIQITQTVATGPSSIEGEIRILKGFYEDTVDLAAIVRGLTRFVSGRDSQRGSRRSGSGLASEVDLNLHLVTDAPILIETDVVQAEIGGDLRILGTASTPRGDGQIIVERGTIGSDTSPLEILNGALIFSPQTPQLNPRLEITALGALRSTTAEPDQVRMAISGTLLKPIIHFDSDSGLSENEIVARLGFQIGARNAFALASSRRLRGKPSDYAGRTSGMSVTDRIATLAGFSEVAIRPSLSPVTGEFTPTVVAKRDLPRSLDLILESDLGGTQASGASVEYPLTSNLNLFSRWSNQTVSDVNSSSGSVDTGVRVRRNFSGTSLAPRSILSLFGIGEK